MKKRCFALILIILLAINSISALATTTDTNNSVKAHIMHLVDPEPENED